MAFKKFGSFFGFSKKEETIEEVKEQEEIQEEKAEELSVIDDTETATEDVASENEIFDEKSEESAEENPDDNSEEVFPEDEKVESEEIVAQDSEEELQSESGTEPEKVPEKKGFFAKLKAGLSKTRDSISSKIDGVLAAFGKVDEELFEELEEALIMADVGVDTSLYIIDSLRKKVKENRITETNQVKGAIEEIVSEILSGQDSAINTSTNPSVIMVIGVNGVGKTTSIGKMASRYKAEGKKVILGAADTFRAAAIDQLQVWADRSGVDIIKHQEGSDPASVVFDTIAAAKSRGSDVIILDTAGRLHNKKNLMDELAKISRIIERELPGASLETLLVLDATTGQNAVVQSKLFSETATITGIILTKLDGSAKGGIVLAIAHEQNIPVKLVGVGEGIDDLQDFVPTDFAKALFD
ncbi:MAG: signal recognition particle-docking protein FtsY [Clostridia bacterium]|nr:signal recognition particle-docking protein FtsY [Clostridia bacterium]